jgi:hypothetical protein
MVKSRRIRWAGRVACMVKRKITYSLLVEKPKRKRLIGRRKLRLEETIKTNFKKWNGGREWIDLAQDRDSRRAVVNEVRKTSGVHIMERISWLAKELLSSQ